jgi:mRNA interferase MazF
MVESIKTSISIPKTVLNEADEVAEQLNVSRDALVAMAIEDFVRRHQEVRKGARVINQGDLFWVELADASGTAAGIRHPHVVIQADVFNHSRLRTVVMCGLTSNLKKASLPGNVLLEAGEGNLEKASVVEVSKVSTVWKAELGAFIGRLDEGRLEQILDGIRFVETSYFGQ